MIRRIGAAFVLSIGVAMAPATLSAQQHEHDADQARASSGPMVTHMMAYMPQRLLSMQEDLGLSEDQVLQLEEMAETAFERRHQHMDPMMAGGEEACSMLSADSPDWTAYRERMQAMAARMASNHVSMMQVAFEARAVLSPEQVEALGASGSMHGMHSGEAGHAMAGGGSMMQGDMMEGGMMQDGMMRMMGGMCMPGR